MWAIWHKISIFIQDVSKGTLMNIFLLILAGFTSTTVMTSLMFLIHKLKWANVDMTRAIGSLYTHSYELSYPIGLMIHYSFGIFFAFIYAKLVDISPVLTPGSVLIITTFVGLVHGVTVGLLLQVVISEHHPLLQFRRTSLPIVLTHVIGHVAYGMTLGVIFAINLNRVHNTIEYYFSGRALGDLAGFALIWIPIFGPPLLFASYLTYQVLTEKIRQKARSLEKKHMTHGGQSRLAWRPHRNWVLKKLHPIKKHKN